MEKDNKGTGLEIAVVGMAGRFPGAKNIGEFWDNLKNGRESISFFSGQELEETGIDPYLLRDTNYVKAKGVLEDIEYFDYSFFDYTRRESRWMDPQFRILHECTWHALEDAGYNPDIYPGAIGLYVGTLANYQWVGHLLSRIGNQSEQTIIGSLNDRDFLSTRAAYKLNLKGPALTVQTACSTSLVAIHMGCQSLLSGESDMVAAGGSSVWLPEKSGYLYESGMIRSKDGKCRAFAANANGTNGGDGVAVVILKRLADAMADRDRIDAVIKGSAINNDGRRKVGYTAPSVEGQAEVIRAAMQMAEVDSGSITMIEAHGTATALGDPVEIEALKKAFASDKRQFCAIGSVKTNVGHLDAAAGAAGFIKAVLALKYRLIPPSLHFEIPNPRIDFENSPFYVNTEAMEWKTGNKPSPLRAGVSSFGLGGTNAHVILEEPPGVHLTLEEQAQAPDKKEKYCFYHLIPLSAKTRTALERLTQNLGEHFNTHPGLNLADAAYTLQLGRKPFKFRKSLVCRDIDEAMTALKQDSPEVVEEPLENPQAVFMFSGQGAQYVNMGLELYRHVPLFAEETDRCFRILEGLMTANLKEVLYPPPSQSSQPGDTEPVEGNTAEIHQFVYASPIKFVFDYSLARLLMKWGIQPYATIGHSFGEYVTACLSGVLSLEDALKLVVERGRLMQQMPDGAMMNVPLSEAELQPYLNDELSLAAVNEPHLCIVSGTLTAVKALEGQLTGKGHECMRLRVPKAGHSPMVEPFLEEFKNTLRRVAFHKPGIPYTSGLSGKWITVEEAADPQYWLNHMRRTNRFSDGLVELFKEPNAVFIEVGSGRGLSLFVNRHPGKGPGHRTLNLVKHHKETVSDVSFLLDKIGQLWSMGINIDWRAIHGDENRCRVSLPLYPFDRHYFSVEISGYLHQQGDVRESCPDEVIQTELTEEERGAAALPDPVEEKTAAVIQEVLGLDRVRMDKDFFELGGDSLTAIMASSKISKAFRVEFPVKVILGGSTVKEIAEAIGEMDNQTYKGIPPAEKREYYPLSSAQKRLFFLDRFGDISTTYHMPYVLKITGNPDKKRLENSFQGLIHRHETLRTSFELVEDEPVQRVHEIGSLEFEIEGYVNRSSPVIQDFVRPFTLSQAPLIRVGLVETGTNEYLLVLDVHHIITDGTSMGVLVNEFTRSYEGRESQPLKIQYKDFSQWQNDLYQAGGIKKQEEYWLNLFPGSWAVPVLDLPLDFPRPDVFTYEGDSYGFALEAEDAQRFKEMAAACDATLFMNLLAAFNVLLSRYSGQDDIVVGSAVAGRSHADLQDLIGMFVNMLAMRNQPVEGLTFLEFLETVRSNCLDTFANQDLQFEDLVDKLELERDTSRNPLFSVSFLLQNFQQPEIKVKDTTVTLDEYWNKVSRFDMSVLSYEREGGIYFRIMYYRRIFKRETIEQMARHFITVIKIVGKQPGIPIAGIELLSEAEKYQLIHEFNRPGTGGDIEVDFPVDQTVDRLFEEQAARTPDRAAVVFGEQALTYGRLDKKSDQLANYLCNEIRVTFDEPVALLMDCSPGMAAAVFGILKAGGAYVPIDGKMPEERIKTILIDAGVRILISGKKFIRTLHRLQWECPLLQYVLCMDSEDIHGEEEAQKSGLMDEKLWEYVGETAVDDITAGGWQTSYTGEPFTKKEMDEYGDNILEKLTPLLGKKVRVLEIGCASGITMYRLAPKVGFYYGTDLSRVIIEKNKERVRKSNYPNIALAVLPAHEIDNIEEKDFDIIIMNSVIQNFHGHNYFRMVMKKCIDLLKERGTIFVGDIMDQDLKGALVREMKEFKQAHRDKNYRTTTDFSEALFLSRAYLEDLALELPAIKHVECSEKIYTIENELTRFRYDACVTVGKKGKKEKTQRHRYQHDSSHLPRYPTTAVSRYLQPHHLAYVIYTSGSTGRPKGVPVEQGNVVHLLAGLQRRIYRQLSHLYHPLRVCMVSPYMFDASVKQLFGALLQGHTLYLVDEETRINGEALLEFYQKQHIHITDGTPSHLRLLVEGVETGTPCPGVELKRFLIGGEALPIDLADEVFNRFLPVKIPGKPVDGEFLEIINLYGPTECTVDALSYRVSREIIDQLHNIPIGTPFPDVQAYIMGMGARQNLLQPLGVAGELCVGGKGVARGYLNNPVLTSEKFTGTAHDRLYRTGDLARWLRSGNVEFLGRIDHQVKIRGFRIELEEIETLLQNHSEIKEAVVIMRNNSGDQYICAYLVPVFKREIPTDELREYLSRSLPVYMLPSYFVHMDKLPLTRSGKANRNILPLPEVLSIKREGYIPPADMVEETLVHIWSKVLGIDNRVIGVEDDFFELGGHSLRATVLASQIHKEQDVKIPLANIFKTPTIRDIASFIRKAKKSIYQEIQPGEKKEYYEQSSAQKRLFFLDRFEDISTTYNMSYILRIKGKVDKEQYENTFKALIARHNTLRTSFHLMDNQPVQKIHDRVEFKIDYFDLQELSTTSLSTTSIIRHFIRPFNLAKAPLLRAALAAISEKEYLFLFDMHHIISDGTSLGILINEFTRFLAGEIFSPLKTQYIDFSTWQNNLFKTKRIKSQEEYWCNRYAGEIPRLNLPTDYPRPPVMTYEGDFYTFIVPQQEMILFGKMSERAGATLYISLLTVFNVLLSRYTGQEDIIVGTAIAGRPHADLQEIIGMFVNMLVMRNFPVDCQTFSRFLAEVKESSVKAFENQDVQFEDLVDKLNLERDTSRNPLFSVSFVVQNMERPGIEVKGSTFSHYDYDSTLKNSRFDISFHAYEEANDLCFRMTYYKRIFKKKSIEQLARHFVTIIKAVGENPDVRLSRIELLSEEEKQYLVYDLNFNNPAGEYNAESEGEAWFPAGITINRLFKEQAEKTPYRAAVVFGEQTFTYGQLNKKSNRLANYLCHEIRVKVDEPVALLMDCSPGMAAAVFGILKAGGAYVPIDGKMPEERIKTILIDAGARILISGKKFIRTLHRLQWECPLLQYVLCMDSEDIYGEEEAQKSGLMDEKLWEYVGETAVDDITAGGWQTSYTGEPFTRKEMDEYGENILVKLTPLLGKNVRVLEIGCASGITMYRLAPKVGLYFGTDLSRVIIEKNKELVRKSNYPNIALAVLPAHEIDNIEEKDFDIIIMNSVIQNFHGHNYFRMVMKKCIDLLKEKGTIFVGDIMDQDLKGALVREMKEFKQAHRDKNYRTTTDFSGALFLSRAYLEDLALELPEVKRVECSEKIYTIKNELTKFRFDACIKVDKTIPCENQNEEQGKGRKIKKNRYQHDSSNLSRYPAAAVSRHAQPHHLAYVIYTSGSTGRPKGVTVEQGNVVHLLSGLQQRIYRQLSHFYQPLRVCMVSPYMFDASVKQLFGALLQGHTLYLVDEETRINGEALLEFYQKQHIHITDGTPSHLRLLVEGVETGTPCPGVELKLFLIGGEALPKDLAEDVFNRFSPVETSGKPVDMESLEIINLYGPTECTVDALSYRVSRENTAQLHGIPIGTPFPNVQAYIMGMGARQDLLQPLGVAGELCIGGKGVARGYLNNPVLTSEKFTGAAHDRLYRTGDLARWLRSGNIEFLGRIDHQVKIRGFRIELEEIETLLHNHDEIKEAAVVLRTHINSDENYICAYWVPGAFTGETYTGTFDSTEIKEYLSLYLPGYMIPAYFVKLEQVPLSPSGKINRSVLPVTGTLAVRGEDYAEPQDPTEKKLAAVWAGVLGIDETVIGIDDDFFESGGHSLRALIVISRIHQALDVKIPLHEIFKNPTIRKLAQCVKKSKKDIYKDIRTVEKKEYYPQSFAQRRLFSLDQFENIGVTYNMPDSYRLKGKIDIHRVEHVFKALIARHETLRTSFHLIANEPVQRIHTTNVSLQIASYTRESHEKENQEEHHKLEMNHIIKNFVRSFDLSRAPLFRVGLVELSPAGWLLLFDMHHIAGDGTSIENLVMDFTRLYQSGANHWQQLRIQYKDYTLWQQGLAALGFIQQQEEYWLTLYPENEEIPILNFPTDFPHPAVFNFEGNRYLFTIDADFLNGIKALASGTGATLFMIFMASLDILLYQYTGQEDIVVGSGTAGRRHADLYPLVGMFINTLPIRNRLTAANTCRQFLEKVKQNSIKAFENQDIRLEQLIEKINPPRDSSRNPLFDVCLVVQNFQHFQRQLDEITVTHSPLERKVSKFDFTLYAHETGAGVSFILEYRTALFKSETINRMAVHFLKVLEQLKENIDRKISEIDILTGEERQQLLFEFNNTQMPYPEEKTIVELFAGHAGQNPDRMSINSRHQLTYGELNKKSNRMAWLLKKKGVRPDTIVAIMVERSIEMIIGMLGILKAGGAYLPIDINNPEKRTRCMLADSGATLLITREKFEEEICSTGIIDPNDEELTRFDYLNPGDHRVNPINLLYVIYTSGSTGNPKGTLVNHRGFVNLVRFYQTLFTCSRSDRMSQVASPGFDAMAFETWPCLLTGAALYIADNEVRSDPEGMKEWLIANAITISFQSTIIAEQLLKEEWPSNGVALKVLQTAGDRLTQYPDRLYPFRFFNLYGPTEGTVWTTWAEVPVTRNPAGYHSPPIGKPIANNRVYIADPEPGPALKLKAPGVAGELCIAGAGLTRGYLNQPEITAEKFLRVSFTSYNSYKFEASIRIYKTGDLARWLADGNIEFSGRLDHQVKIRGFRIEPGEIEYRLTCHNEIKEAVVMARNPDMLCAYVVPKNRNIDIPRLREYLSGLLPFYMVPAFFIQLEQIPLNPSGKVDQKKLPEPKPGKTEPTDIEIPRDIIEKRLVEAWSEILGIEEIGTTDNFFEIGGDSIKAIQVKAELKKHGLHLKINDLFLHPNIKELADILKKSRVQEEIPQEPVEGEVSLTPIQHWFFQTHLTGIHHFNHALMLYRDGPEGFEADILEKVFAKILEHHDALRIVYVLDREKRQYHEKERSPVNSDVEVRQWNRGARGTLFDLNISDLRDTHSLLPDVIEREANRIQQSINLEKGPLVKLGLFKTSQGDHLLIVIHHLVVDGISWRILMEDFSTGYQQLKQGKDIRFQEKTHSFQYWCKELTGYARGKPLLKEAKYWQQLESEAARLEQLPKDWKIGKEKKKQEYTANITLNIDKESTELLLKKVNGAYNTTINDILLTALGIAINEWAEPDRVLINLEGHGRESIVENVDVSRTVGWFTALYPVILDMRKTRDLSYTIRHVKESLRRIPNKGIGYGILKYLTPVENIQSLTDSLEFKSKPEITFNYLGQFDWKNNDNDDESFITISPLHHGEIKSPVMERSCPLDINGMVAEGKLSLVFTYNRFEYKRETIEKLAAGYRWHLIDIIDHCSKKEEKELTPSDMGYAGIKIEEIDAFEDEFSDLD